MSEEIIVATDCPPRLSLPGEKLEEGRTGRVFDMKNVNSLSECLLAFTSSRK